MDAKELKLLVKRAKAARRPHAQGDVLGAMMESLCITEDEWMALTGVDRQRWADVTMIVLGVQGALLTPTPRTDRWLHNAALSSALAANRDDYGAQLLLDVGTYFRTKNLGVFRDHLCSIGYGRDPLTGRGLGQPPNANGKEGLHDVSDAKILKAMDELRSEAGVTRAAAKLWIAVGLFKKKKNDSVERTIDLAMKALTAARDRWSGDEAKRRSLRRRKTRHR